MEGPFLPCNAYFLSALKANVELIFLDKLWGLGEAIKRQLPIHMLSILGSGNSCSDMVYMDRDFFCLFFFKDQ